MSNDSERELKVRKRRVRFREEALLIKANVLALPSPGSGSNFYIGFALTMFNYMAVNKGLHAIQFGLLFAEAAKYALYQNAGRESPGGVNYVDLGWSAGEYARRLRRLEKRICRRNWLKNVSTPA